MRFPSKRRGISYIMSVVMMTLVITALSSVVLFWGLSTIGDSRVALTGAVKSRMDRTRERILVEDVQIAATTSTLRVYVRNTGDIQIVVDAIYINHIQAQIKGTCKILPGGTCTIDINVKKLSLSIQEFGALEITLPSGVPTASPGSSYLVRAATSRGTPSTGTFVV